MNDFPFALVLIVLPLVGGVVVGAMQGAPPRQAKLVALGISLVELVLAALMWVAFTPSPVGYQFSLAGSTGSRPWACRSRSASTASHW